MTAETGAGGPQGEARPWHRRLAALSGWRRLGLAAVCGGLASLAMPPLYLLPLLVPAFVGAFWLLDGAKTGRQAALTGWAFGTGHFAVGLYWVGHAFLVDAERFGFAMPFAVGGLAAGLALFPALAFWITARSGLTGPARVVCFATAWLLGEGLRSWVLTGFPWNLMGSVWAFSAETIQLSALGGVWLLGLITVTAATAPALLAGRPAHNRRVRGRVLAFVAVALLLPAVSWGYGAWRLAGAPSVGAATVEEVRLRLVQPSIPQALKWRRDLRAEHVRSQMRMSLAPGFEDRTHIIWAETAIPYLLSAEPVLQRELTAVVPPGGFLIAGAPRVEADKPEGRIWNSLYALDDSGRIAATFDKVHLVPFGEYTPLRDLLGLAKLTAGSRDFSPGSGLQTIDLPGLPAFSPLICYEIIFPGKVTAPPADGGAEGGKAAPRWLLNVTNDAWFGDSSGPYQHFASARMRAVEEGIPLIRVANNGISAVVDSYGRILDQINLNDRGIIDTELPEAAAGRTIYSHAGNWLYLVELFLSTCVIFVLRRFV